MSLNPMSERARELLLHYREAESLSRAEQARLLEALQRSLAGGQAAGGGTGTGAAGGGAYGALAAWAARIGPRFTLGALLSVATAAWVVHAALETRAPHAVSAYAIGAVTASGNTNASAPDVPSSPPSPGLPVTPWTEGSVTPSVGMSLGGGPGESRTSATAHVARGARTPSLEHGAAVSQPHALAPSAAPASASVAVVATEASLPPSP
jgi:hypothetical protein